MGLAGMKLALVGCGKMGGAMLDGWLAGDIAAADVVVIEPFEGATVPDGVTRVATADEIPDGFTPDIVIHAVKPQMMDEVVPAYGKYGSACHLSIAAGKSIAYFASKLGGSPAIVRAMPNTPAAVGRGITVAVPNDAVTEGQRNACDGLLSSVGEVAWIDDEEQLDAVTALSGGGPAYVFLLMEVMAKAGVEAGLPEDLAMRLARVTVSGAGELARLSPEEASQLRINVTSPGGTTAEALKVLMDDASGIGPTFVRAIAAATARSKELAG
jgi:pyrroline-5-carboxylate reductase